jgi:hypothetical protein
LLDNGLVIVVWLIVAHTKSIPLARARCVTATNSVRSVNQRRLGVEVNLNAIGQVVAQANCPDDVADWSRVSCM